MVQKQFSGNQLSFNELEKSSHAALTTNYRKGVYQKIIFAQSDEMEVLCKSQKPGLLDGVYGSKQCSYNELERVNVLQCSTLKERSEEEQVRFSILKLITLILDSPNLYSETYNFNRKHRVHGHSILLIFISRNSVSCHFSTH